MLLSRSISWIFVAAALALGGAKSFAADAEVQKVNLIPNHDFSEVREKIPAGFDFRGFVGGGTPTNETGMVEENGEKFARLLVRKESEERNSVEIRLKESIEVPASAQSLSVRAKVRLSNLIQTDARGGSGVRISIIFLTDPGDMENGARRVDLDMLEKDTDGWFVWEAEVPISSNHAYVNLEISINKAYGQLDIAELSLVEVN